MIKKIKQFLAKSTVGGNTTILWAVLIGIFLVAAIWTTVGIVGILQNNGVLTATAK